MQELMTEHQERHLAFIKGEFSRLADLKYRKGQKEHGGNLTDKRGLIDMAIDEAIDQVQYLLSLKQQIIDSGVVLGSLYDK